MFLTLNFISVGKIEKNSWKNSFGYALKFIEINLGLLLTCFYKIVLKK